MTTYLLRFTGDPIGYRVVGKTSPLDNSSAKTARWVDAYVGMSEKQVQIDAAKAYVIEEIPDASHRRCGSRATGTGSAETHPDLPWGTP